MKFAEAPGMPIPLLKALTESNQKYKDELSSFLEEHRIGKNDGINHFSVTTLFRSPRQVQLLQRHRNEIIHKPNDSFFTLKGSIIHYILEMYSPSHWLREERLKTIRKIGDERVMLHGQPDAYDPITKELWDWKYVSGISVRYDRPEHKLQLNILRFLFEKNNMPVDSLKNCYIIERLDPKYLNDPTYPKENWMVKEHEIMRKSEVANYVDTRLQIHLNEISKSDKDLPFCTDSERWIRSNEFVVYKRKNGSKKAPIQDWSSRSIFRGESRSEALEFLASAKIEQETKIVEVKGYPKACDFCLALPFCNQRQKELLQEAEKTSGLH